MAENTFDIEHEIELWRRSLLKYQDIDPEDAEELASGLQDRYEALLLNGHEPRKAFELARRRISSTPDELAAEYGKVNATKSKVKEGAIRNMLFLWPNYLKIGLRNLGRKVFYNSINYVSLAVGLTCCIMALLYIDYETSFDDHIPEGDRIFRVGQSFRSQDYSVLGFERYFNTTGEEQMAQIDGIRGIKGVADAVQFYVFDQPTYVRANDKRLTSEKVLQTNTPLSFFEFFDWEIIAGSSQNFSEQLNALVIVESEAERFFGKDWKSQDLMGTAITIEDQLYTLSAVIKDVPENSHFDFNLALHTKKIDYWGSRTYIKVLEGEDKTEMGERLKRNVGLLNARFADSELFGGFTLDNIREIHLNSDKLYEMKPPGDRRYLYIFGIISGIILLLTVSNYTNLSIAMNASRMREIGMRKIFGASRGQVSKQFLMESVLLAVLCVPLVLVLLVLIIPRFNSFMGIGLSGDFWQQPVFWILLISVTLLIGILAGLYPAIYLGGRHILHLFSGNLVKNTKSGFTARKAIITFQFTLLVGLCSLTLLVNDQLRFIQDKDLGYSKEGVLYVDLSDDWETFMAYKNELLKFDGITGVGTGSPLGRTPFNQTTYKLKGTDEVFDDAYNLYLDYSSVKFLNMETTIPDFLENPDSAPNSVVLINETAADKFQAFFDLTKNNLLGRTIIEEPEFTDEETGQIGFPIQIDGFYKDINVFSLKEAVTPMFITVYKKVETVNWAAIAFDEGAGNILEKARSAFEIIKPDEAFVHSYLSQNINELYKQDQKVGSLCIYFSIIAFVIALIGLIALTAYLTTLKKKEIGMRKVLGASTFEILKRFNGEYVTLLVISLLVATPLTYYGISKWLSNFAYRIEINFWVFLLAALLTFIVSGIAVSLMTLKVAQGEPVDALQENQ